MDPVVGSAGSALVGAMAADAWQQARDAVVGLWRSRRPAEAAGVAEELESLRTGVLAARAMGDDRREAELTGHWRLRLAEFVAGDPETLAALDRLRDAEFTQGPAAAPSPAPTVTFEAQARDHATVIQVGGNAENITFRLNGC